jgi:hypothetical protein
MSAGAKFDAPPVRTPFFGKEQDGTPSWTWKKWLQSIPPRLISPAVSSAPATATATGIAGQIAYDGNFIYICVGTDSWKRAALSAF